MLDSQKIANKHHSKLALIDIDFDHFVKQHLEQMTTYLAKGKINKFDSTLAIDSKGNLLIIKKAAYHDTSYMYCIKHRFSPMMRYKLNDHDFATRILEVYQRYLMARFKRNRRYVNHIFVAAEDFPDDPMFTQKNYIDYCFDNLDKLTIGNEVLPNEYAINYYPDYFISKALVSLQSYDHITFKMWKWIASSICHLAQNTPGSIILFKQLCNIFNNQFGDNNSSDIYNFDYTSFIHNCDFMNIKRLKLPISVIFDNLNEVEFLNHTKIILNLQTPSDVDIMFDTISDISSDNYLFEQQALATLLLNVFECRISNIAKRHLQNKKFNNLAFDKIQQYLLNYH